MVLESGVHESDGSMPEFGGVFGGVFGGHGFYYSFREVWVEGMD